MNLREVIEKNKKLIWTYVPAMDDPMEPAVYESNARKAVVQGQVNLLDAIIKRVNQEASEYVNDEQAGRTALAYELHNELSRAREDITSLQ